MHQQTDVTGGLNTGGNQAQPPLQQQQHPAGPAPGVNPMPQGPQTVPRPEQQGQRWKAPLSTPYDPTMYQQAIEDALAARAAMEAELQQNFLPMPGPGFDPYDAPYYDPYYDPFFDPSRELFPEDMGPYDGGFPGPEMGDPLDYARAEYEEMLSSLPGMIGSLVADRVEQAQARNEALEHFFEDYPALAGARGEIAQLLGRGIHMDDILQLLQALNPGPSARHSSPSIEQRRQLRNETFVETGAADPYVDPVSQDDERMIKAAAKHLFNS